MVQRLTTLDLRSQDPTTLTVDGSETLNAESNKERTVFRFMSTLDAYVEVTLEATDSTDPEFSDSVIINEQRPVPANTTRELRVTGPYEFYRITVEATQNAPTSGSLTVRSLADNSDAPLQSETLNEFESLNQGKSFKARYQEELANAESTAVGLSNTNSNTVFIDKVGLAVGGDALIRTSVDHGSYTDGTEITPINGRPELQVERDFTATLSSNPTFSDPQIEIEGYRPGGSGGPVFATQGTEAPGSAFELDPGQTIVFQLENISGNTNRFGYLFKMFDTVIR